MMVTMTSDGRSWQRVIWAVPRLTVLTALCLISSAAMASAQSTVAKIVGLGAATCADFTDNIEKSPAMQRDYLAWAQGFMSGILLSMPSGVDEGLDLNPQAFGLLKQLGFLLQNCAENRSSDFADAVVALYKTLRTHSVR
jgi:hypothetical protein